MLKICHVTSVHPRYDIRIFVKECQSLARSNYNVSLIVADNLVTEEKYQLDENTSIKIFNVGKEPGRLHRMWKTPKKIYHKILELKPTIIHFHDPELILIALKLQKKGFKVIYDVHEDLPKQIQNKHWLPGYSRNIIAKIATLIEKFVALKISGIVAATPIIAKRFATYNLDTITVCNYPILTELSTLLFPQKQESLPIKPESQIQYLNSNKFTSEMTELNLTNDYKQELADKSRIVRFSARKNIICYIGSISKPRGIIPLIESLKLSKIHLELAGSISSDLSYEELKHLSGFDYVNYHGILNRNEIITLLGKVKIGLVTLLPTPSYVESLPIKMFEYMLAGIPVIASNFPLWADIIEKYKCGILVDPSSPYAIANASEYLINHDDIAEEMGLNGQNAVLKHFNWEQEELKLLNFYQTLG